MSGADPSAHALRCLHRRQYARSLEAFLAALARQPDSVALRSNAANVLMMLGDARAAAGLLAPVRAENDIPPLRCAELVALLHGNADAGVVAEKHRQWARCFEPLRPPPRPLLSRRRGAPVRLGYLSGNFRGNAEFQFILPVVRHHDRSRFTVYCYSNAPRPDAITARFRRAADHWRDIAGLDSDAAARLVESDQIDILVDCSGHFLHGRPDVLARAPAPVLVSMPTYPATLGLDSGVLRICDRFTDPPGLTEHLYTERLVRLPRVQLPFDPWRPMPSVSSAPVLRQGHVTFGVFHRRPKITPDMLEIWARILRATPRSRILFHHLYGGGRRVNREFTGPIRRHFAQAGVNPSRVTFAGEVPLNEHYALYSQIDLSLDSFPYCGMTITCESLWMGVPVVTLAGEAAVSRMGVSILSAIGRPEWIARTASEYIDIATGLASRPPRELNGIRRSLRPALRASALLDHRGYAAELEAAYLRMLQARGCR